MTGARHQNLGYIVSIYVKQWPAFLICAVEFICIGVQDRRGTAVGVVAMTAAIIAVSRRIALAKSAQILRLENVEDAIARVSKALPAALADRDAFLTAEAARLRLMWGDTANADRDMQAIAWSHRSPLVQAETHIYQALRAYFAGDAITGRWSPSRTHRRSTFERADTPSSATLATLHPLVLRRCLRALVAHLARQNGPR